MWDEIIYSFQTSKAAPLKFGIMVKTNCSYEALGSIMCFYGETPISLTKMFRNSPEALPYS